MKARFFTFSMLFLFLNACTSIKELAEQGRYDEAIAKGAKKLRGKDLKDPNVVALIESSFNKANFKDLNLIQSLYANNDWRNNEKVLRITKAIAARQNLIKPFLPLIDSKGYVANFNLINIEQINELATKNISDDSSTLTDDIISILDNPNLIYERSLRFLPFTSKVALMLIPIVLLILFSCESPSAFLAS